MAPMINAELATGDRSDIDVDALSPSEEEPRNVGRKAAKKSKKSKDKSRKKSGDNSDVGGDEDLFRVISNPDKMLPNPREASYKQGGKKNKKKKKKALSVQSMSSFSDYSSNNRAASSIGMGSYGSQASYMHQYADDEQAGSDDYIGSADGQQEPSRRKRREDIMQEKIEMLSRISKMSKQGFAATKKWGIRDDIDEIRFECYRMTRENNSKRAVKNMQHGLITMATILEFANSVINPFNLKLQGFSRNMMLTVSDYDDSLEAIHHKWSGRTSIGPELTVLFTFATSAVFHHAGNVSNGNAPATSRQPQQPAPKPGGAMGLGDMSSMLGLFSSLVPKGGGNAGGHTGGRETATAPVPEEQRKRKPMKGPRLPMASMSLP